MRKKSYASSTPSVAGASGDTHPPLHHISPKGESLSGNHQRPHPKPLTLSQPQDSQLRLGRPVSVSNVCVLDDEHLSGVTLPLFFLPFLVKSGLMSSLRQKAVTRKTVLSSTTEADNFSLCLVCIPVLIQKV